MILSMTGYGKYVADYNGKKIHAEIKSLNSKTMDISTRIAPLYREKEIEIRTIISKKLERGKVDFNLWAEQTDSQAATPINKALMSEYYRQMQDISAETGIPMPADCMALLVRMPDVMTKNDVEELSEEEWNVVAGAVDAAIDQLVAFRRQEGDALRVKFTEKIENIASLLQQIEPYEKDRTEKIRQQLIDSLENKVGVEYDKNRLEQEMIYYIEKLDINEEKQRLSNHLKYFMETMDESRSQGKKLGFIAQEMGREINTTGSKSNQAEMQNIVVKMKDELEQIKEQVLNVL